MVTITVLLQCVQCVASTALACIKILQKFFHPSSLPDWIKSFPCKLFFFFNYLRGKRGAEQQQQQNNNKKKPRQKRAFETTSRPVHFAVFQEECCQLWAASLKQGTYICSTSPDLRLGSKRMFCVIAVFSSVQTRACLSVFPIINRNGWICFA